jgi:hypothetical protein
VTIYCQHCGKIAVDPCFYDDDEVDKVYHDAERYRWLREHPSFETEALLSGLSPQQFDELVDLSRSKSNMEGDGVE